nr:hypothetical protein [Escherichia coli]
MLSDNYNAITLGNSWNTPLGAISFDATRSALLNKSNFC